LVPKTEVQIGLYRRVLYLKVVFVVFSLAIAAQVLMPTSRTRLHITAIEMQFPAPNATVVAGPRDNLGPLDPEVVRHRGIPMPNFVPVSNPPISLPG
jgi:hypothetical protein